MSELPPETSAPDPAPPPEPPGEPIPEPVPGQTVKRGARGRGAAAWLIALLVLILAGVAAAPFWAPSVMPLLPWSRNNTTDREQALTARLAALEKENAALKSAQGALAHRRGDNAAALAGVKSELAGLGQRVDALAAQKAAQPALDPAAVQKLQQDLAGFGERAGDLAGRIAAIQSGLANLGKRVDAVAARPAAEPAQVQKLQQDLAGIDRRAGDLANRVAVLETRMAAPARTESREAALLVALLQMRERLDAAQPFAASYNVFLALAQGRAKLLAAAKPLAAFADEGVASRAALARDLSHLAGPIATARTPAAVDDWGGRVLDQLRRLVTIRHIGGSRQTPPEAAVEQARADLARGDLAVAVKAIESLSGPSAAAARPWLAKARRRLAAETALARLQQRLEAGIMRHAAPASPAAAVSPQPKPGPGAP